MRNLLLSSALALSLGACTTAQLQQACQTDAVVAPIVAKDAGTVAVIAGADQADVTKAQAADAAAHDATQAGCATLPPAAPAK